MRTPARPDRTRRAARCGAIAALAALLAAAPRGQHVPIPLTPSTARAMHAPQPYLPPLAAWQHVANANRTFVAARTAGTRLDEPPVRPSGAGRWVCAVIACADVDVDLPPLLGLERKDVLELRLPGPFATPETVALLERAVAQQRLSLVVMLAHDDCLSLAPLDGTARDELTERRAGLARDAARAHRSLADELLREQRERLLAASDALHRAVEADRLRVMPGLLDERTAAIQWRHQRADELPLAPVR